MREAELQDLVDRSLHTGRQMDTCTQRPYVKSRGWWHLGIMCLEKAIRREEDAAMHGKQEREQTREKRRQEPLLANLLLSATPVHYFLP